MLVEKPPAATVAQAQTFVAAASDARRGPLVAWHSREADGVAPLADWLAERSLQRVDVCWREDVRVWHPGQEWIWEPGIGVFDPGVNALSILTRILPDLAVRAATLGVPEGRQAPIDAQLSLRSGAVPVTADLSFDRRGPQTCDMRFETTTGVADLRDRGARLLVDGVDVAVPQCAEYRRLYDRFAALIATRSVDADLSPFRLVADAFVIGAREARPPFSWHD